jgi:hypothetical protein
MDVAGPTAAFMYFIYSLLKIRNIVIVRVRGIISQVATGADGIRRVGTGKYRKVGRESRPNH